MSDEQKIQLADLMVAIEQQASAVKLARAELIIAEQQLGQLQQQTRQLMQSAESNGRVSVEN